VEGEVLATMHTTIANLVQCCIMARSAFINFFVKYHNANRGRAPVTKLAKEAGALWRRMTPEQKMEYDYNTANRQRNDRKPITRIDREISDKRKRPRQNKTKKRPN